MRRLINVTYFFIYKDSSNLSSLALMSIAKVSDIGVIASLALFLVSSSAPAMIIVSSRVSSPPFPACIPVNKKTITESIGRKERVAVV